MSSPRSRARWLRGALVGVSSAVVTVGAHAAGGAGLPHGAALVVSLLACATVGALVTGVRVEDARARLFAITGALVAAQSLGHLVLASVGEHHEHAGLLPSPAMIAAHMAGAVLLGVAINAVEYLYVVCASVLCWLRLFAISALQPVFRHVRHTSSDVVAQSVLLLSGLGMRAPPAWSASTA